MGALLFAALLLAAPADPTNPAAPVENDAPTVGVSLDHSEAHVGDRLTLTISAVAKAGVTVTLQGKLDLSKLELLDRADGDKGGRDLGDGRRSHRFVLGVAAYEVGELEVPSLELSYGKPGGEPRTLKTEPLPLHVKGLVADDEAHPEAQPIRPPRSALIEDKRVLAAVRWGLVGLGGAIVLLTAFLFVRRALRKRRAQPVAVVAAGPVRPPDEIAMEKLRALRAAGDFGADGFRPFAFAVAEIVRAYLGARYKFDSLELTTTELLDSLNATAAHLTSPQGEVVRFLKDSDLIKFARTGATDERALGLLDAAQAIVLSTAAPLEEAAQSVSGPVLLPRDGTDG